MVRLETKRIRISRADQIKINSVFIPLADQCKAKLILIEKKIRENNATRHSLAVLPLKTIAVPFSASVPEP